MTGLKDRLPRRAQLGIGAAVLVALGAAGGAGAVSLTRPSVEMAPTVPTAIAKLPATSGVVTVKGRVAEVFGDRFVVQDASGRAMVSAGREGRDTISPGRAVTVQGRYSDGQLHASYLVDPSGQVEAVGPAGRPPHPPGPHGPGRDGPPPPPPGGPGAVGSGAPPPPPPGCAPAGGPGFAPPPPPPTGAVPPAPQAAPAPIPQR